MEPTKLEPTKLVYVAGPYRASTEHAVLLNIQRAESLAAEVWRAGAVAICPHKNSAFFGGIVPDAALLHGDLEIIRRCDALILTSDWQRSTGAVAEVNLARSIPIPVFERIDQLRAWLA